MSSLPSILILLAVYLVVPILLVRAVLAASWMNIVMAYALWLPALYSYLDGNGASGNEVLGWMMILGLFFTVPAIFILVLVMKAFGALLGSSST